MNWKGKIDTYRPDPCLWPDIFGDDKLDNNSGVLNELNLLFLKDTFIDGAVEVFGAGLSADVFPIL